MPNAGTFHRSATARLLSACMMSMLLGASSPKGVNLVTTERLVGAEHSPQEWLSYGGTYAEQHFSPLTQINEHTVSQLGLAWYADIDGGRGIEATPLMANGILYLTSAWSIVYAYDARTGRRLWMFDPGVPRDTL